MNIGNPTDIFPVKTGATLASEVTTNDVKQIIEQSVRIDLIHRNHKAKAYSQKVARKQLIKGRIMSALTLIIFCLFLLTIGKVSAEDAGTYIQYGVLQNTSNVVLNAGHKIINISNIKISSDVNVGDNVTCTFNTDGDLISVEKR